MPPPDSLPSRLAPRIEFTVVSTRTPRGWLAERMDAVAVAWARHPAVAFARHRRTLGLFRSMHELVRAGASARDAIGQRALGADSVAKTAALAAVAIDQGATLADALRAQPRAFDPQIVALVDAGEQTGTLEAALARVLAQLERAQAFRRSTLLLSLYPAYLLGALVLGGSLLDAARGALGGQHDVGALFSETLSRQLVSALAATAALFLAPLAVAGLGLSRAWEVLRARLPIVSRFYRGREASRFCATLASAWAAGADVTLGLTVSLAATGSSRLADRASELSQRVRDGQPLTETIAALALIDDEALRRLASAEQIGRIDLALQQTADEYEASSARWLRVLVLLTLAVIAALALTAGVGKLFSMLAAYQQAIDGVGLR